MRWLRWSSALAAAGLTALAAGCALPVHANAGDPKTGPPVISQAVAWRVLASYTADSNEAGRVRSTSMLATCEAGSAEQIDAAGYTEDRASHPNTSSYQPRTYAGPAFYIPRQWSYPRWFVVQARSRSMAGAGSPENGSTYLLFQKQSVVAPWLVVLKPDSAMEGKQLPRPESGVAPTARLAVPAPRLAAAEAAYLNGTEANPFGPDKISGQLQSMAPTDRKNLAKAHPTVADRFSPGADGTFALAVAGGGALVFSSVTDTLDDRVPSPYKLSIHHPLYAANGLSELRFAHVTQIAAYDPPAGRGKPEVVASYFGVTGITGT